MSNPEGDAHSKSSIIIVAACIATMPTSIHEAVSNGSENTLLDAKASSVLGYTDIRRVFLCVDHSCEITAFINIPLIYTIILIFRNNSSMLSQIFYLIYVTIFIYDKDYL